ncbi:unnamed protein product [Urochloa decumbens]|uniref:Jacalin-type lectin domain-containing protein n=1 Tax=Urochloa decumbens TaxID=240449 RepID=A0ABC9GWW6_9POAL
MAKNKLKLSGAAVLLVIVVPLFMYGGALLIGIQLGRALERSPDSMSVSFSIRGALAYLAKELWYSNNNVLGLGRRGGKAAQVWVAASLVRPESSDMEQSNKHRRSYIPFPRSVEGRDNSSAAHKAHRHYTNHTWPRGVMSVGPWGGSGGQPFYMLRASSGAPRLHSITVQHSPSGIHSLACQYSYSLAGDESDRRRFRLAGPWGRPQSSTGSLLHATINLAAGEYVTAVEGTVGHFATVPGVIVTSLAFRTNTGRTYGPYGRTTAGTTPFSVPAADGACIVGFWGRSGWLLDAIGVYMKPCSSSSNPAMRRQG